MQNMYEVLGSIPRFSTEFICVPNSHLHNYYFPECVCIIHSLEWHGGQVVRRRSRKPKIMGSNPIRAFMKDI